MPSPPKISVVMPCFNQGAFVAEAVDSVLAQSCQDFEIVIVNDGSTDEDTLRRLQELEGSDIQVIHSENLGLPGARNLGIRATEGSYVCALDADDLLEPSYFEKAVGVLDSRSDVAFVSHWLRTFGDEEWDWMPERCDLPALLDMNTINGAALVRREILQEVGLYDDRLRQGCEDWDLWLTIVERGHRGVILPEILFRYRRHADAMSREMNRPVNQLRLFARLIDKHRDSYQTHLLSLWQRRQTNLCDLQCEIYDLQDEADSWWEPELQRRRDEVDRLRERVASPKLRKGSSAEVERGNRHSRTEVGELEQRLEALLTSRSWRWTGPIRRLLSLVGGPQEPKYED